MRILLRECEAFGSEFDLTFNADKTRLIRFSYNRSLSLPSGVFQFSETVTHLGIVLHGKLMLMLLGSLQQCAGMQANYVYIYLFHTFGGCDNYGSQNEVNIAITYCLSLTDAFCEGS